MVRSPGFDTHLIRSFGTSDQESEASYALVYERLRRIAAASMRRGHTPTLQPTALVNEAWIKLRGHLQDVRSREHFLALAGLAMRQILSDHARAHRAQRRDGRRVTVTLDRPDEQDQPDSLDLIALDEALTKLNALKERHARVVELRFLCSLTIQETAEVLGISHATVESDWAMARNWLREELARS